MEPVKVTLYQYDPAEAKTINLSSPLTNRDGSKLSAITLQEPKSAQLIGVKMIDLLQMDADALLLVITRVSEIADGRTAEKLTAADLLAIGRELISFFADVNGSLDDGPAPKASTGEEFVINEPDSGALRGLQLVEVASMDMSSLQVLVPRISKLSAKDFLELRAPDCLQIAMEIAGFFIDTDKSRIE